MWDACMVALTKYPNTGEDTANISGVHPIIVPTIRAEAPLPSACNILRDLEIKLCCECVMYCYSMYVHTVETLNKDTFGTSYCFVLCRELGCPLSEVIFFIECVYEYIQLVLC